MAGCNLDRLCEKTLGSNRCREKRPQCAINAGRPEEAVGRWIRARVTGIGPVSQYSQEQAGRSTEFLGGDFDQTF